MSTPDTKVYVLGTRYHWEGPLALELCDKCARKRIDHQFPDIARGVWEDIARTLHPRTYVEIAEGWSIAWDYPVPLECDCWMGTETGMPDPNCTDCGGSSELPMRCDSCLTPLTSLPHSAYQTPSREDSPTIAGSTLSAAIERLDLIMHWLGTSKYSRLHPTENGFIIPKGILARRSGREYVDLCEWLLSEGIGRADDNRPHRFRVDVTDSSAGTQIRFTRAGEQCAQLDPPFPEDH